MDTLNSASSKRINVLTLDGGGVRGLSTLLILQVLMKYINESIQAQRHTELDTSEYQDVEPHDIFDLVAGTSTGGLIAVMLGKLGMTVEQCIEAYRRLSVTIFGRKHLRARVTGGLAPARYSGSRMRECIRGLIKKHRSCVDLPMAADDDRDKIACALICREHGDKSRYSDFKPEAVPICSLPCPDQIHCLVCEAGRATSAAPTYFPVQNINGRYFVDGGMEFNNPSHKIFDHYTETSRAEESRRSSVATEAAVVGARHGNLDFSEVRFVNLGTGTEPKDLEVLRNQWNFAFLVPGTLRMLLFLKRNLTKMATNSERVAQVMKSLAYVADGGKFNVKYKRFSADNGVCFIKLDKYKKLGEIESLTLKYLERPRIQTELRRLADEIASDYLEKISPRGRRAANNQLTVPGASTGRPQTPIYHSPPLSLQTSPCQPTELSPQSPESQPSSGLSTDRSDGSAGNTPSRNSSTEGTSAGTSRDSSPLK